MLWVVYFQEMVHIIIINLNDWSGVCIWNRFRVILNWKIWRVNLNITIINGTMIKSPRDSLNHRTVLGSRHPGFGVSWRRLDVPLSWWIIWFITTKGVEFINISSKICEEEFRATYDAGTRVFPNPSTAFSNTCLYHAESCNKWLESCCIIVDGIWRTKMTRALTQSRKYSWGLNNF